MNEIDYIDSVAQIDKLRQLAKAAVSETKEVATVGLYLSEQNQMLQDKISDFEYQIKDLYTLFDSLKPNSQQIKEQSLDIDRLYEENSKLQNRVSKLQLFTSQNADNIAATQKSQNQINQELSSLSYSTSKLQEHSLLINSKISSLQQFSSKIERDVNSIFESNLSLEARISKIEQHISTQKTQLNSRLFDIDSSINSIFNANKAYQGLIQTCCSDQAESKSKIDLALNNINFMVEIFQQAVQDLSQPHQKQELAALQAHTKNLNKIRSFTDPLDLPQVPTSCPSTAVEEIVSLLCNSPQKTSQPETEKSNLQNQLHNSNQRSVKADTNLESGTSLNKPSFNEAQKQVPDPTLISLTSSSPEKLNFGDKAIPNSQDNQETLESIEPAKLKTAPSFGNTKTTPIKASAKHIHSDLSNAGRRKHSFLEAYKRNYKDNLQGMTAQSELGFYQGSPRYRKSRTKQLLISNTTNSRDNSSTHNNTDGNDPNEIDPLNPDPLSSFSANTSGDAKANTSTSFNLNMNMNMSLASISYSSPASNSHSPLINSLLLFNDCVGIRSGKSQAQKALSSDKYIQQIFLKQQQKSQPQPEPEPEPEP